MSGMCPCGCGIELLEIRGIRPCPYPAPITAIVPPSNSLIHPGLDSLLATIPHEPGRPFLLDMSNNQKFIYFTEEDASIALKAQLKGAGVFIVMILFFILGFWFPFAAAQSGYNPNTVDTFAGYSYRNHSQCQISSLDLHSPFAPLCFTKDELLAAISGGGRIGFEAPFMPRGCDMQWFDTEQVCEIASRFSAIVFIGDSMMRHVVGATNVLLREDLGYGAVTNWNFEQDEFRDCFCNHQFDVKDCSLQGIYSTADVLKNDPDSLACTSKVNIVTEMMLKFPLVDEELTRLKALLSSTKPNKPYAFIFGHGLWNDLDIQATVNWLDGIHDHAVEKAPYLKSNLFPRLFISPNAAGILKPDQWILSQGDKALQLFEHATRGQARLRGIDHLGTWNMSIQADKFDGVHLDLKGNLIKAMAVINWLDMIETEKW